MTTRTFTRFIAPLGIALGLFGSLLPVPALAATSTKPACVLVAFDLAAKNTPALNTTVTKQSNSQIVVLWASANATKATDTDGSSVKVTGFQVVAPTTTTTYTYTFVSKNKKKTTCSATVEVPGSKTSSTNNSSTSSNAAGTISVSSLPLLTGGAAPPNTSVPVAYIKVSNPGSTDVSISGFTLTQNGSASTDVVTAFSTSDDKGGSRSTITQNLFSGSSAYVPLTATITSGQTRIFTIKATVSATSKLSAGQSLMLDLTSVDTTATARAQFPVRGTTWTF